MRDVYDEAINYFRKHPLEISEAWETVTIHPYGFLFGFMGDGRGAGIGCLTMIKSRPEYVAETAELTRKIRSDDRVPGTHEFTFEMSPAEQLAVLPVFAEYQREADRTFRHGPVAATNSPHTGARGDG